MPANVRPCSCAQRSTSASRFWIAAWLGAVMPTRRPAASAATIIRAPRNVLPVPGGPWTGRTEWSSPSVADDERVDVLAEPAGRQRAVAHGAAGERTAWNLSSPASTD